MKLEYVFGGLLLLFVLGWAVFSFGIIGDTSTLLLQFSSFLEKYQSVLIAGFIVGVLAVGWLLFSPQGARLFTPRIPQQSARPFSRVWSAVDEDDDWQQWAMTNLMEFFHPPLFESSGLKEGGQYYALFRAKSGFVPEGFTRLMIAKFLTGIVSNPFMETKSRMVALFPYEASFRLHRAKKLGDFEYENLGLDAGAINFFNKLIERKPELLDTLDLASPLSEAVKTERGGK